MLPEAKFVHGNGKVTGLVITVVQVPVIHRDQVHVTENEAVVFCIFKSLCVANVKKLGPIEGVLAKLKHNRKNNSFTMLQNALKITQRKVNNKNISNLVYIYTEWDAM